MITGHWRHFVTDEKTEDILGDGSVNGVSYMISMRGSRVSKVNPQWASHTQTRNGDLISKTNPQEYLAYLRRTRKLRCSSSS